MEVITLARDLIKIPSPSGEEKEIGEYLAKRLEKNFDVKLQSIGDSYNLLATKGEPKLILTTHTDTVPKQIKIVEDENWFYGRGACDTKGIIASMICAGEEAIAKGFNNFGLLFDVSEETDFSGIKKARELVKPEIVIVGEPTNFKMVFGQKGLMQLKIKCHGESAPGSLPDKGISAINSLIKILNCILNIKFPIDQGLGATTLNIGKISGGSAPNIVSDYAEATIEIRTTKSNSEILTLLKTIIPGEGLEVIFSYEPVINKNLNFIKQFTYDKITVPYFTEMYFWIEKCKVIVFGPGKYEFAHSDEERIEKKDLINGQEFYLNLIKNFVS